jgi:hypothetical protein
MQTGAAKRAFDARTAEVDEALAFGEMLAGERELRVPAIR